MIKKNLNKMLAGDNRIILGIGDIKKRNIKRTLYDISKFKRRQEGLTHY